MDDLLQSAFVAALDAVDPHRLVRASLALDGTVLRCGPDRVDLARFRRVVVAALGKAAGPMTLAALDVLGDRVAAGVVVSSVLPPLPSRIEGLLASHPVPDARSLEAGRRLHALVSGLGADDFVLALTSGGGSSLAVLPAEGLDLDDQARTVDLLLRSPLSIAEVNAVRRPLSRLKGGGLARAAGAATILNLIVSDVVGDDPAVIASGPFVPDLATAADALAILERHGLVDRVPARVVEVLRERARQEGARQEGARQEGAPRAGRPGGLPPAPRVCNRVIGSNRTALQAAAAFLRTRGVPALVLSSMLEGEVRELARFHAQVAREVLRSGLPVAAPCVLLSGGESFVQVRGPGKGGRNQEFALHFAVAMEGEGGRWSLLSAGTDGIDGPTDAAGAIVDPDTLTTARALGLSLPEALSRNDAYPFLDRLGALVRTGPTGTNVGDVRFLRLG